MPGAPAVPGAPPAATTGLPQSTFWGSVLQGFQMAPAYKMQQLQLDSQRLQNYEQYYNMIVPQVLSNPALKDNPTILQMMTVAAKQAGVPAPIVMVNGKPQIDVTSLGQEALNDFVKKNGDQWYRWDTGQRVAYAQHQNWIPQDYNWQVDPLFTQKQTESPYDRQLADLAVGRLVATGEKSGLLGPLEMARDIYDREHGEGTFEKNVPDYKFMLDQARQTIRDNAQKLHLDIKKEEKEIDNLQSEGRYREAEIAITKLREKVIEEDLKTLPQINQAKLAQLQASTANIVARTQQLVLSGGKAPAGFTQQAKQVESEMNNAVATAKNIVTNASMYQEQNRFAGALAQQYNAIVSLEPQYFSTHILSTLDNMVHDPSLNQPIYGIGYSTAQAYKLAYKLLQARAVGGAKGGQAALEQAKAKFGEGIINFLVSDQPDIMNYVTGQPTSLETQAQFPQPGPTANTYTDQAAPEFLPPPPPGG